MSKVQPAIMIITTYMVLSSKFPTRGSSTGSSEQLTLPAAVLCSTLYLANAARWGAAPTADRVSRNLTPGERARARAWESPCRCRSMYGMALVFVWATARHWGRKD